MYFDPNAPAWAVRLQTSLTDVQQQIGNVQQQIGNVQQQIGNVQQQIDNLQNQFGDFQQKAKLRERNVAIKRGNRKRKTNIIPPLKEISGYMNRAQLASFVPLGENIPDEPPLLSAVGSSPPTHLLPQNYSKIYQLTHPNILGLMQWYHNSFEIDPQDDLDARKSKVADFFCY
eukprot:TRINITY_DN753_c0_g1_i2.p1 TRINITY_DN753_c0_g1~~TRINITY_DN753_c0_g1_i2.p1  ORF type:complete len:173 (+),score=16.61 TRINITY_DN753_c0_g1_i2:129-647(+)